MNEAKPKLLHNPESSANFLSRITFVYMIPFLIRGFKKQLEEEDLCEPIPDHKSEDATRDLTEKWENERKRAKEAGRKPSLFWAIVCPYTCRAFLLGILLFVEESVRITQPLMIGRLTRYFQFDSPLTISEAYFAAGALAVSGALCPFLHHPYFYGMQKLGFELRIGACGLIMQKGLRLSCGALHKTTIGHIVTIMSTDVARFDFLFLFVNYLWIGPFMFAAYIYMLWRETGPACIAGCLTLILFVPIQGFFSRQMGRYRKLIATQTDKRISVMDEILNGIRVVKMYAWEDAFASVIEDLRKKEMEYVKTMTIWQSLMMGTFWGSTKFIVLSVILTYLFLGNQITAERVFVTTALFNACRLPLTLFLPQALQLMLESKVSFDRIQRFLELEEFEFNARPISNGHLNGSLTESVKNGISLSNGAANGSKNFVEPEKETSIVEVEHLSATWDEGKVEEAAPALALQDVSFSAVPGDLVAIIGPVGCGKSSLLFTLLRETRRVGGKMVVKGSVAYVSQDPWLFSGTVKDNILFGRPYDEERYREAIRVCCLRKDLIQLPHGDMSSVGDRGHSLSGGQKARVSLARAVYSNADIYLLDDPLSAVDATVGRYLFKKCIMGFLKTKITILVTHQVQFLHNASLVILMQDGKMVASGTMKELNKLSSFADIIEKTEKTYSRHTSECEGMSPVYSNQKQTDLAEVLDELEEEDDNESFISASEETSPLMEPVPRVGSRNSERMVEYVNRMPSESYRLRRLSSQNSRRKSELSESSVSSILKDPEEPVLQNALEDEDRVAGAVSWRIYLIYLKSMADPAWFILLALLFAVGVQIFNNSIDWWLNKWSMASEKAIGPANETIQLARSANTSVHYFLDVIDFKLFTLSLSLYQYRNAFAIMVFVFMVVSILRCVLLRVAQVHGCRLLHNQMFQAVVKTPIIFFDKNPIGRILNRFSKDVGMMDEQLSFVFFEFFAGVLQIAGTTIVIIILNPIIFIPFIPLVFVFWALREFYLASSRDVKRLEATTRSPLYSHISAVMHGLTTVRSFRNEPLAMTKFCQYQDLNSSAFFLGMATGRWFASVIDWLVAFFIAIVAFSCLLTKSAVGSGEVALMLVYVVQFTGFFSWIMRQSAEVQNGMVSIERIVNYTELPTEDIAKGAVPPSNWPYAGKISLKKISLRYEEDGEYILKCVEAEIQPKQKIGIVGRTGAGKSSLLRALFRLTEPEGVVEIDGLDTKNVVLRELRKRLSIIPQDPVLFIGSLRRNLDPFDEYSDDTLWDALEQAELKPFVSGLPEGLQTHVKEGGANFSVGQRQLICLARAILRHAKVLVIDEATANVDPETDALIQRAIKANFIDSTVLTVAHRLHTIMDSDKVMVLENGSLIEFDHPHLLLQDERSAFSTLVGETGEETVKLLKKLAAASFDARR